MKEFKTAGQIKAFSRECLFGNYGVLIFTYSFISTLTYFVLNFVSAQVGNFSSIYLAAYFIIVLLYSAFMVGQYYMYRKVLRGEKISVQDMWYGFKHFADKAIFLQFLLLIPAFLGAVPVSMAMVVYSSTKDAVWFLVISVAFILYCVILVLIHLNFGQAFFLLLDYPEESGKELLIHSMRMMKGHKFRLFYLYVTFIGMGCLVILSFGIALLWVFPYITCSRTLFYEELYAREPGKYIDVTVE
ncbi:MAG: DUF975 family protein [Lachnospiraceae bacterium]|jgi:uncharacterized membrane protein|nr:DUF975 family protein [Lachnospiraceae bacterium]